jgi:hypothetical protein
MDLAGENLEVDTGEYLPSSYTTAQALDNE